MNINHVWCTNIVIEVLCNKHNNTNSHYYLLLIHPNSLIELLQHD